jgi:hypothetical protein
MRGKWCITSGVRHLTKIGYEGRLDVRKDVYEKMDRLVFLVKPWNFLCWQLSHKSIDKKNLEYASLQKLPPNLTPPNPHPRNPFPIPNLPPQPSHSNPPLYSRRLPIPLRGELNRRQWSERHTSICARRVLLGESKRPKPYYQLRRRRKLSTGQGNSALG